MTCVGVEGYTGRDIILWWNSRPLQDHRGREGRMAFCIRPTEVDQAWTENTPYIKGLCSWRQQMKRN